MREPSSVDPIRRRRVKVKRRDTHAKTLVVAAVVVAGSTRGFCHVAFGHLSGGGRLYRRGRTWQPAVVVLLERSMPDDELQQIAFELGVSETAFVRRWAISGACAGSLPTVEVELCGHADARSLQRVLNELGVPGRDLLPDACRHPLGSSHE